MESAERLPILVVEDEAAIRRGLCDLLAYHGMRAGKDALEVARVGLEKMRAAVA